MSKVGEITDVGKFIREILTGNPKLKNREVANLVINHFPGQAFDGPALRQRVANFKYLENQKRTVHIVTKGN